MYQSKRDPSRKFGSAFVGKRFDSYTGGTQPGEENSNEHSDPQEAGSSVDEVREAHGPAHQVTYHLNHDGGESKVRSFHGDGHVHESAYKSPAEAFEAGGELQASDVKRRTHPDQQGSSSEGDNDLVPQHEAADLV